MAPLAQRSLHVAWVTAGERRLVARALRDAGFSQRHIAALLNVSQNTVSKDVCERESD